MGFVMIKLALTGEGQELQIEKSSSTIKKKKKLTSTALFTTAQTHKQASDSTWKYYRRTSFCLIIGLFLNNNFKFRKSTLKYESAENNILILNVHLIAKFMMDKSENVLQLCFSAYKLAGSWNSNVVGSILHMAMFSFLLRSFKDG
jgi:transaldolase